MGMLNVKVLDSIIRKRPNKSGLLGRVGSRKRLLDKKNLTAHALQHHINITTISFSFLQMCRCALRSSAFTLVLSFQMQYISTNTWYQLWSTVEESWWFRYLCHINPLCVLLHCIHESLCGLHILVLPDSSIFNILSQIYPLFLLCTFTNYLSLASLILFPNHSAWTVPHIYYFLSRLFWSLPVI